MACHLSLYAISKLESQATMALSDVIWYIILQSFYSSFIPIPLSKGKVSTNTGVLSKYLILSSKDNANYSFGLTVSPPVQQLIDTLAASDPFFCSLSIQKLSLNPHAECLALPLQNYTYKYDNWNCHSSRKIGIIGVTLACLAPSITAAQYIRGRVKTIIHLSRMKVLLKTECFWGQSRNCAKKN